MFHLSAIRFRFAVLAISGFMARIAVAQIGVTESGDSTGTKSMKREDPRRFAFSEWKMGKDTLYAWDSSFSFVHRYNLLAKRAEPYTDLGVNAGPARSLFVNPFTVPGFQSGLNLYAYRNKLPQQMQFYRSKVPFTRFSYVQGGNGVFVLDALHTQNLSKTWNITIDYSSAQNGEIYTASKQSNLHRGTMLGSHYTGKNGRYSMVVITSWNRARRTENHGILPGTDTFFFHAIGPRLYTTPFYYPHIGTASSSYKANHHVLMQRYFLGDGKKIYLFHQADWTKESYAYTETSESPDTGVYGKTPVFQPGAFKDSSGWIQYINEAGIGNHLSRDAAFPLLYRISASSSQIVYNSIYKTSANYYLNQALHGSVLWDPYKKYRLHFYGKADLFLAGFNAGDYNLDAALQSDWKGLNFTAGFHSQSYTAPFYMQKFATNFRRYFREFKKVNVNAIYGSASYRNKRLKASADVQSGTAANFLYAGENGEFKQGNQLDYITFSGSLNVHAGKFYLDNRFTFQTHNQMQVLPVPRYSDLLAVYFEGHMFKKAMYARIGADVWIQGSYTGYLYAPEYAVFYPGIAKAGNYPVLDFFASGEVKTLQFFVKMEHLNQRFYNYGFNNYSWSALQYPMEPLRFRFGINWKFYN